VRSEQARRLITIVAMVLCTVLGVMTFNRNVVYASEESIAADVVQVRPENAQAQLTYGTYLVGAKRPTEAEPHLRAALTLRLPPSTNESKLRSLAHLYLGMALASEGKPAEAAPELEQAIVLRSDLDRAYPALAEIQLSLRRTAGAVSTLNRALERHPDDVVLLKRLAWILATSSDPAARNGALAVKNAERAVTLTNSTDALALDVLAAAYAEAGQFDAALSALARSANLVRANGPADLVPTLRAHLELFEAKKPVRTNDW
jgi:tetratricopeptide (TPR) repeat protein